MNSRLRQLSIFDRLTLPDSIELSLASLNEYGQRYRHWVIAYSGGKDSSATTVFVAWAIKTGQLPPPESLTILYSDTRQELPPLQQTAMGLLAQLQADGFTTNVVLPELDLRFYVYMLGRGVPPPKNTFRWCTTFEARERGLDTVLDIQRRVQIDLVNSDEEARIRQLWQMNTWPNSWTGNEISGNVLIDAISLTSGGDIVIQSLLIQEALEAYA